MKNFYKREWELHDKLLVTAVCLLFGMVLGFLTAPVKKGVYCGNNNGNYYLPKKKGAETEELCS